MRGRHAEATANCQEAALQAAKPAAAPAGKAEPALGRGSPTSPLEAGASSGDEGDGCYKPESEPARLQALL